MDVPDIPLVYRAGPAEEGGGVDLGAIVAMLWRRKWTIALAGGLVFAAVAIFTLTTPETYESSSTVLVERRNQATGSALEVLENVGTTATPMETEINLAQSRRVIEPVVEQLQLNARVETEDGNLRPTEAFTVFETRRDAEAGSYRLDRLEDGTFALRDVETEEVVARSTPASTGGGQVLTHGGMTVRVSEGDPGIGGVIHLASFNQAVASVQSQVGVSPVDEGNLLRIHCTGTSASGVQALCEAVTNSYLDLRAELQKAEAVAAAEFLKKQVEEVRVQLAEAEDALGEYQERNQAVALNERAVAEVQQYGNLETMREQLRTERAALRNVLQDLEGSGGSDAASLPGILADRDPTMAKLFNTLVDLQDQRSELAVTRSDRNPDVAAVDARIQQVQSQIQDYARTYDTSLQAQISSLSGAIGASQGQLSQIPGKQVASGRLQRQVQSLSDLYNFLQARLREAEVAEQVNLPSVKIVDQAAIPLGPASPNKKMNLALGLLLGLGFGVMLALYREYSDSKLRERADVEERTGVPVLGMVPTLDRGRPVLSLTNGSGPRLPGRSRKSRRRARLGTGRTGSKKPHVDELAFESFRSLLTDLKFLRTREGAGEGGRIRTVAITSPGRGDGKTFSACNLALVSAALGDRTLLIDSDLRASGVSQFLDLSWRDRGFTDLLDAGAKEFEVEKSIELGDAGQSLKVITAGSPETRSIGVLERRAGLVDSVLKYGEENFDLVIVDTPPLNVISDAAVITSRVDAVLIVVRGGATDRAALDLTLDRLQRVNSRVVGIVLNDVNLPEYYTSYSIEVSDEEMTGVGSAS